MSETNDDFCPDVPNSKLWKEVYNELMFKCEKGETWTDAETDMAKNLITWMEANK